MLNPRPYGLLVIGDSPTDQDQGLIESLVRHVTNIKDTSGINAFRMVRDLPDGGYVIVKDEGGTLRVIVDKASSSDAKPNGLEHTFVPMLFSGVINRNMLKEDEGTGIKLTHATRRRLYNYDTELGLAPEQVYLKRFKIEYAPEFYYFKPEYTGIYTFTQYVKQKPTWYSGAMAEVIQIVGGYGIQSLKALPEDSKEEQAQVKIPEEYLTRIIDELGGLRRLPGYTGYPDAEGFFKYDYKANLCHVVSFDRKNHPWLIQINGLGVYAMPLPMIPATQTQAYREYIESVQDEEILKILDRFGGLPSGEEFPKGNDFHAWKRAGAVIKVCDTSDFYQFSSMYLACGWSVNSKGTEGFNTCWGYDSSGLLRVHGYKLKLDLTAVVNNGKIDAVKLSDHLDSAVIVRYLNGLNELLEQGTHKTLAIQYKLRRVPQKDIYERAVEALKSSSGLTSDEVDYWDNLTLEPIATHTGSVTRVTTGPAYWGLPNPMSMGRLKFPELSGQGCESFIMHSPEYKGGMVRSDTVMFGCYVDDQLKVVKYFIDERKPTHKKESTFENIMIVGQWEETVTSGNTGLSGYFYTSDFDDRTESPDVTLYTHITGTDMGYGNPAYHTPHVLFSVGSLSRARYYKHVTRERQSKGKGMDVAVCVPVFERDAMLYAYEEHISGGYEREIHTQGSMMDPTSYELWCYDAIFHYMGQTGSGNKGEPPSKNGTPVYVDTLIYSPTESSDFADSGNWFGLPAGGFINVTAVCGPYTSRTGAHHNAAGVVIGGEAPRFEPYEHLEQFKNILKGRVSASIRVAGSSIVHRNPPEQFYFAFSPQDAGGSPVYFYRDSCGVVFGDANYVSISEKDAFGRRKSWGHTQLADHKTAQSFIGVINE